MISSYRSMTSIISPSISLYAIIGIMEKKLSLAKIEKDIRHLKNLAGYSGYWHGLYYYLGIPQVSKLKKEVIIYKYKVKK